MFYTGMGPCFAGLQIATAPLTRYNIIANLTCFQLFPDCSALCSDWSAILCDLCYWCNFRVFNFMAHVSSSYGCCRNNIILYNAVSSNITVIISNFEVILIWFWEYYIKCRNEFCRVQLWLDRQWRMSCMRQTLTGKIVPLREQRWLSGESTCLELASYADTLWACHTILLPHECLLKPSKHLSPFVLSGPDQGCVLCTKD